MIVLRFFVGIVSVVGGVGSLGAAARYDLQGQGGLAVACFLASLALLTGDALA